MHSRDISRRELIANAGRLAAIATVPGVLTDAALGTAGSGIRQSQALPAKAEFSIPPGITFLNSAWSHPLPIAGAEAMKRHADTRSRPAEVMPSSQAMVTQVKQDFAALIGATPREISFVPNTSTGENLVVNGLGIPAAAGSGINVVTDGLHFDGALVHLQALQRERSLDLRIVAP
ncbi:MAG: aminotransferase class V-fold PLP-dependent enzyme, partial [Gemmatimonadota bacterium]|nr:aminotransferase class V-fold PLP-dependent enzyme [Gemmatimonadota bacterium]